jgi:hypothetical protein
MTWIQCKDGTAPDEELDGVGGVGGLELVGQGHGRQVPVRQDEPDDGRGPCTTPRQRPGKAANGPSQSRGLPLDVQTSCPPTVPTSTSVTVVSSCGTGCISLGMDGALLRRQVLSAPYGRLPYQWLAPPIETHE